jgi:aminopeptidase YwaD
MNRAAIVAGSLCWAALGLAGEVRAQKPPLLPEKDVAALANELSGETAKRNLEGIARFDRRRGSQGFHEAAELVAERLRAYGLSDVAILQFPADGEMFYGTQRSRPAWDAQAGELSELTSASGGCVNDPEKPNPSADEKTKRSAGWPNQNCNFLRQQKNIASYDAEPVVLAEDSESADVWSELVDVGEGTRESDYAGKEVKGKMVLVGAQPGAAQDLAVGKFGAAGIVSYAQNQKTAWSGENQDAIRWGHLETFSANKTFAFMVSLKTAHALQARLAKGEKITLLAVVKAGQHSGNYEIVTATIAGADPKRKEEEIVFSCHLDHQRPGANDNASGCATILEVARTLKKLIDEKKLQPPARTIEFIFPPEIEGTMALLTGNGEVPASSPGDEEARERRPNWIKPRRSSGPELAKRIKAVIHMDMVGGGPETKAVFHVTGGPMSLPSFVHDVAWSFAEWVNEESYKFAATGEATYPMVAPEGGTEPLRAEYSGYTMGSDHDVYQDSSFGIPAIYVNDWPDRFIHTNFDSAANIDPTKLKRAALIGAASGYFLARLADADYGPLLEAVKTNQYERTGRAMRRASELPKDDGEKLLREFSGNEQRLAMSIDSMIPISLTGEETRPPLPRSDSRLREILRGENSGVQRGPLWKRKSGPKGPLLVFGYDYFAERAKAKGIATPKLLSYQGRWGGGEEYAYEVLNFANGQRGAQGIRDAVSAEYGPVPLELVVEYLQALEKIGIVEAL